MAAVASMSGLRVGLSHSLSMSQCAFSNRLSSTSLSSHSACVLPTYRSKALHGPVARASSVQSDPAGMARESELERNTRRIAAINKANRIKERVAKQKSLHEAEGELRFLEAQLKVSVPVGMVTAAGIVVRMMVAGMPANVQNPHADWVFFVILFFAVLYLRPFFQYPGAKKKWSNLSKAVEEDMQLAAKELD